MTINITRYFGINLRRMPDAINRQYLCGVVWFPRSRDRLGYGYFSMRWL